MKRSQTTEKLKNKRKKKKPRKVTGNKKPETNKNQ